MNLKNKNKIVQFIEDKLVSRFKSAFANQIDLYNWCDADMINISGN